MKPMRTFLAIELDNKITQVVQKIIEALRHTPDGKHLAWIPPQNLHLTVRFIGDTLISQSIILVENVSHAIKKLPQFKLQLDKVDVFPSRQHPRVVVIEMVYSNAMQALYRSVEEATIASGFAEEERPSRPHLTIARVKSKRAPRFHEDISSANIEMLVNEVVLVQSILGHHGPSYKVLERMPFG